MFYDNLDMHLLGGTQWGWETDWTPTKKDGWNDENFSIVDQRRILRDNFNIRPYPQAIAGIPGSFKVHLWQLPLQPFEPLRSQHL
jgi:endoglycosylceramidase